MKKVESTSVEYLIITIVTVAVAGMILWPLFDLFWCAVVTHTEFVYSVADYIMWPIVFAGIVGIVFWVLEKKKAK